ncbi:hypothetical protein AAW14_06495 [Streptomyces hygroscopicus]|uniref:hypothetical protein n=1 Tax=Streptomyces hygroscopicus TaxID=1912 RepID=UPI0022405DEA|nr:hypothetical protein [Streptomyces hygroscopicus]MCW7941686.1 hypothetical protein [Streptomyces hygroscopicus]
MRLRVSVEVDEDFRERGLDLLDCEVVSREQDPNAPCYIYTLTAPSHAPDDAVEMSPIFSRAIDGTVTLLSYDWLRADGSHCERTV